MYRQQHEVPRNEDESDPIEITLRKIKKRADDKKFLHEAESDIMKLKLKELMKNNH